jgi:sugar phosphate isomerase/epimerase
MKLSISNIAWSAEHDAEMYQFLHDSGFQGLEIAPTRIFPESPYEKLDEAKAWATNIKEQFGLEIPSMQSIWYGHQEKIFGTKEERKSLIDYTKKAIDFAESIGCNNLVFGNPRNRDTEDVSGNYQIAIDFFREIGDYAAEHHTIIAIEANPIIYNTHFINTTEQAVELCYKCNSDGMKVNVDLGTIIYNHEDIDYLYRIPEFINHVHISEPGLLPIEQRELHHTLFHILHHISYDKYVSIEMGNKNDLSLVKTTLTQVRKLYNHVIL